MSTVNGRALGVTRTAAATAAARLIEDLDETTLCGLKTLVDAEIERRLPDRDGEDERWGEV